MTCGVPHRSARSLGLRSGSAVAASVALIAALLAGSTVASVRLIAAQEPAITFGPGGLPPLEDATLRWPTSPSTVFAADGSVIARFDPPERFHPVDPNAIPPIVAATVTSAEDPNFFSHHGFVPSAMVRAAFANAKSDEVVQGGSTITQQLAKNLYTSGDRTLGRKVDELRIAVALEDHYSKNELLAAYLNTAYFGEGAIGIAAAANTYFGKSADQLTLSEAALLTGLIPAPSQRDPRERPASAASAWLEVLHRVADAKAYGPTDVDFAIQHPPALTAASVPTRYPYFVDYVRSWLITVAGLAPWQVQGGGLQIQTTLDPVTAEGAVTALRDHLTDPTGPTGAVVVLDHRNGHVLALTAGTDWNASQVNLALGSAGGGAGRQAGSSFKPFVLATALAQGFRPNTVIPAPKSITVPGSDHPIFNDEGEGYGSATITDATVKSINTAYTWLGMQVGPQNVATTATRLGIHNLPSSGVGASIALGAYETSPLDMASAYGGFAEDGRLVTPTPVLRVTGPDGKVIVDKSAPTQGPQVIDPAIARTVTATLQQVIQRGTGTAAAIDRPAAGKTGTTDQHANVWFVGYTPQLVTAVWVGHASGNVPMHDVDGFAEVFGGTLPALIWHDTMLTADHDIAPTDFPAPLPLDPAPPPPSTGSARPAPSHGSSGGGGQQSQTPAPPPKDPKKKPPKPPKKG